MESKRVKIHLKYRGVEAEIECEEGQLKKAVEEFLSAFQNIPISEREADRVGGREMDKSMLSTCRGVILNLWREGWFSVGRSLAETHEEMSKRGFHYDRTAVAHTLTDLVRSGVLYRDGKKGKYKYYQKRPPM